MCRCLLHLLSLFVFSPERISDRVKQVVRVYKPGNEEGDQNLVVGVKVKVDRKKIDDQNWRGV